MAISDLMGIKAPRDVKERAESTLEKLLKEERLKVGQRQKESLKGERHLNYIKMGEEYYGV